jgi:gluconolactonase
MRLHPAWAAFIGAILIAISPGCRASAEQDDGGVTPAEDAAGPPSTDAAGKPVDAAEEQAPDGAAYPPLKFADIGAAVLVSNQFYFTEGPVWDPVKGVLYFTDINAPQDGGVGGAIYRLTLPSTIDVLLAPDGNADGLALDPGGNIIAAGFVSRSVWRLTPPGTMQTLGSCAQDRGPGSGADAGQSGADSGPGSGADGGQSAGADGGICYADELNTPDDITSRSDGVLYFTDPTFGSGSQGFPAVTLPLSGAQGVYRVTTDGVMHLEDATTSGPNGVNLSPDEKTLYVSYTLTGDVAKFDVAADGSLSGKTTFATGATVADSMCVDAGGDVYVGTVSGLAVYDPAGKHLGTISAGGLIVTNCAFGGPDQRTLFITARTQATLSGAPPLGGGALYQVVDMPVPGIPGQN